MKTLILGALSVAVFVLAGPTFAQDRRDDHRDDHQRAPVRRPWHRPHRVCTTRRHHTVCRWVR